MREKLIELLGKYFDIGDSYAYNLTRVKTAFEVGTISLEDFEEFDEETITDLADYLIKNGVVIPVRCGECAYAEKLLVFENSYSCLTHETFVSENDYCSDGEPKEKVEE